MQKKLWDQTNCSKKPGDLIHADFCRPIDHDSFSGYKYYVLVKYEFTRCRSVYFLKKKTEALHKFKIFLAEAKILGHTVKEVLTDGGGECYNKELKRVTEEMEFSIVSACLILLNKMDQQKKKIKH